MWLFQLFHFRHLLAPVLCGASMALAQQPLVLVQSMIADLQPSR
jgi:hypothetical protein